MSVKIKNFNLFILLVAIFITTFMTSVETTIVTTALPTIVSELHGISEQNWVFTVYLLTTAISTPIYGKLSDRLGRKPMFLIGIIIFILGSTFCGIAPTMPILILARAIQGIGSGALAPITMTIIADVFSLSQRANIMAMNNTAWGISALVGPLIGGFIVDRLNWHWIYFINVPLGIIVLILISCCYKEHRTNQESLNIDYRGIIYLTICLLAFLLGLQWISNLTVNFGLVGICLIITIITLILFIRTEKRAIDPVIPLTLFKSWTFTIQILTALILSGIQIGFQVYFPMWLQSIYRVSATIAGLAITPSPVCWLISSFFVGMLMKKFAPKFIAIPVILIQGIFYIFLVFSGIKFPLFMFYVVAGITGTGLGIVITMNTIVAQETVPVDSIGTASSMITLGRTLGQTIMTGIFGLIFNLVVALKIQKDHKITMTIINKVVNSNIQLHISDKMHYLLSETLLSAFHGIFLVVLGMFIIGLLINASDSLKMPLSKMKNKS